MSKQLDCHWLQKRGIAWESESGWYMPLFLEEQNWASNLSDLGLSTMCMLEIGTIGQGAVLLWMQLVLEEITACSFEMEGTYKTLPPTQFPK